MHHMKISTLVYVIDTYFEPQLWKVILGPLGAFGTLSNYDLQTFTPTANIVLQSNSFSRNNDPGKFRM